MFIVIIHYTFTVFKKNVVFTTMTVDTHVKYII